MFRVVLNSYIVLIRIHPRVRIVQQQEVAGMPRMVEVTIDSVRVSLTNQQRIVVLREKDADRYLPIWIGPYEAEAITISLQEVEVARPQTHDLLKNLLSALNARLTRVEIVGLHEDVFYASLVLEIQGNAITIPVDSRPSDAIALAVRAHAPIFVSRDVMEAASIAPETETNEDASSEKAPLAATLDENPPRGDAPEERLSVFEDFLKKLDKEPPSETPPGEEDDESPDPGKKKK